MPKHPVKVGETPEDQARIDLKRERDMESYRRRSAVKKNQQADIINKLIEDNKNVNEKLDTIIKQNQELKEELYNFKSYTVNLLTDLVEKHNMHDGYNFKLYEFLCNSRSK